MGRRDFITLLGGSAAWSLTGPNIDATYAQLATYVVKLIHGALPGELPIEQPTRFELVINQHVAAVIGVTLPEDLLTSAEPSHSVITPVGPRGTPWAAAEDVGQFWNELPRSAPTWRRDCGRAANQA